MRRWKASNNYSYFNASNPSGPSNNTSSNNTNNNSDRFVLKCTDLPQFDACMAQADMIQNDDKLHLRNLCNDTARCASLVAIHTSKLQRNEYAPRRSIHHKIILDYSRQRVTGETMEQLFDLADAVGLKDRTEAMYAGKRVNTTEDRSVLHHVLRMPAYYDFEVITEVSNNASPLSIANTDRLSTIGRDVSDATINSANSATTVPPLLATPVTPSLNLAASTSSTATDLTCSFTNIQSSSKSESSSIANATYGNTSPTSSPPTRSFLTHSTSISSTATSSTKQNHGTNNASSTRGLLQGYAVLKQVNEYRSKIQEFVYRVRSGEYSSIVKQDGHFTNFLVVGNGSSIMGPQAVAHALMSDTEAADAAGPYRQLRFVSNIDPVDMYLQTKGWKASKTLVIFISMSFTPGDPSLLLARTAQTWLVDDIQKHLKDNSTMLSRDDIIGRHMIAITYNQLRCQMTFPEINTIFTIPAWVSTRYSLFSPVGLIPLALQFSYPIIQEVMEGAHDMDEHFFKAPLRDNLPVIMGLLGVWNSTFLGCSCRAVIPYSQALAYFPAYVQHIDMESNGKRVAIDGTQLFHRSGEVTFGSVATTCQYSFFQLLHQGRVVPADFIGFMESPRPIDLPGEAVSNHDELMSNFFAQPDALAYGKTLVDLIQEGTPEPLREHMVFTGNRPSTSILMTRLDAFSIGQLIALYEHRSVVQGFIWGINSFDCFGNELGTNLAKHVQGQLSASRKTGASVQGFNASTSALLEHYLAHGKYQQQQRHQHRGSAYSTSSNNSTNGVS